MTDSTLKDSLTVQVPSLAELRAWAADVVCLKSLSPEHRALIESYPALLDIAEAAQALDTALLHDAVAGEAAKLTLDDLDEALAKVRP